DVREQEARVDRQSQRPRLSHADRRRDRRGDALLADRIRAGRGGRADHAVLSDRDRARERSNVPRSIGDAFDFEHRRAVVDDVDVARGEPNLCSERRGRRSVTQIRKGLRVRGEQIHVEPVRDLGDIRPRQDALAALRAGDGKRGIEIDGADVKARLGERDVPSAIVGEILRFRHGSRHRGKIHDRSTRRSNAAEQQEKESALHFSPPKLIAKLAKNPRGGPAVNARSGTSVGWGRLWKSDAKLYSPSRYRVSKRFVTVKPSSKFFQEIVAEESSVKMSLLRCPNGRARGPT